MGTGSQKQPSASVLRSAPTTTFTSEALFHLAGTVADRFRLSPLTVDRELKPNAI